MSGPCSAKPLRGAKHELAELGNLWHSIGAWPFPVLEDELGEPACRQARIDRPGEGREGEAGANAGTASEAVK